MQKEGLSPLIATILLIGMSIVLAVSIFGFTQGWFAGLMKITGEKSLTDADMLNRIQMNVDVQAEGNKIRGTITNNGQVDFESVKLNVIGDGGSDTIDIGGINKGDVFNIPEQSVDVGYVQKVIVVPEVNYGGGVVMATMSRVEEEPAHYPYILTGENERFSNKDRCSPDLYVLENNKIKFFVSTTPVRHGPDTGTSCVSGSYTDYGGIPMRIWTKNSQSSSYRNHGTIIDNTRLYIPGTTYVSSISQFNSKPDVLEIDFNQQGNLKPKIRYILKKGWNYVKVEFSVENIGSSIESVQLRWDGDNDPPGGTFRNGEGITQGTGCGGSCPPIPTNKWMAFYSGRDDIYGIVVGDDSQEIRLNPWHGINMREPLSTSLSQGQTHTMVFYILSDFKGPGGNEWKAVEDLYNSL